VFHSFHFFNLTTKFIHPATTFHKL
jgi:hypothetical protein